MKKTVNIVLFLLLIFWISSCWNNVEKEDGQKPNDVGVKVDENDWWMKVWTPPKNNFISVINKELWEE